SPSPSGGGGPGVGVLLRVPHPASRVPTQSQSPPLRAGEGAGGAVHLAHFPTQNPFGIRDRRCHTRRISPGRNSSPHVPGTPMPATDRVGAGSPPSRIPRPASRPTHPTTLCRCSNVSSSLGQPVEQGAVLFQAHLKHEPQEVVRLPGDLFGE